MKDDTKLVQLGRGTREFEGTVNVAVHRASTILSKDAESYLHRFDGNAHLENITYGANGTHNARALANAVAALENVAHAVVTASGLSAISMTLSALTNPGDHLLVSDSVYGPTRRFCNEVLSGYGIETTYYTPTITAEDIKSLIRPDTRLLYMEAPGSLTFEMQDVPALTRVARERSLVTVMDNTWATPLFFKPLDHGVDVSIQAGTKYIAGHSDLVVGFVTARDDILFRKIFERARVFGDVCGPDDCFLALRGLRTLAVRLRHHGESALTVAQWLHQHPAVKSVLFPALETDPGHALWKRDFQGAASLFGLILHADNETACKRFIDRLKLFQIGSSWGGFESLVAINRTHGLRTAGEWRQSDFLLRLHIGLEDPEDLIADLNQALS